MNAPDDYAILAALLWDRPALLRSAAPGARAFAEALGPPPYRQELEGDAPLDIAARGIRFELGGQPHEALEQYARLGQIEGWPAVLGGFLFAWSAASGDAEIVDRAAEATRALEIKDGLLRARMLVKLATYALDKQRGELFAELMDEAVVTAPAGSYLRRAVRIARANLLDHQLEEEDFVISAEADSLVDYS